METEYREQFIKFGLKVQYYRKLRGMTQEAFADEIGADAYTPDAATAAEVARSYFN